jgi:hypothetical protein
VSLPQKTQDLLSASSSQPGHELANFLLVQSSAGCLGQYGQNFHQADFGCHVLLLQFQNHIKALSLQCTSQQLLLQLLGLQLQILAQSITIMQTLDLFAHCCPVGPSGLYCCNL